MMQQKKLWIAIVALVGSGLSGTLKANDVDSLYEEAKSFETKTGEIRNAKRLAGGINCTSQIEKTAPIKGTESKSNTSANGKSAR